MADKRKPNATGEDADKVNRVSQPLRATGDQWY
jgi:hypothetical protein